MKKSELISIIREEIQNIVESVTIATTTRDGATYAKYDEYAKPVSVVIHMTDGRKLKIARQFGGIGTKLYQVILQSLDEYTSNPTAKQFLDKLVNKMSDNLLAKNESNSRGHNIRESSDKYNDSLNSILEKRANDELKTKLSPVEYTEFFTSLTKIDKTASNAAKDIGDEYFPLETLTSGIEYLERYLSEVRPSSSRDILKKYVQRLKQK